MSIENLYPYAGTHAIENTLFVLEWNEPLSADAIASVNKLAGKFRALGLGEVTPTSLFAVKIEADGAHQVNNSSGLGGVSFSMKPPMAGLSRNVTVNRTSCVVAIPDYTRWEQVFRDVETYLDIVLEQIAPMRPLSSIALQYVDVFVWRDDPKELKFEDVFMRGVYLPEKVFEQKGMWHAHQGEMNEFADPPHARLDNINVDVQDVNGERTIRITGAHKVILKSPLWQANKKNKEVLESILTELHKVNKDTLKGLLAPAVRDKIGLS
jgi:uncharacterized protein (TIGR04255 family)